MRRMLCAVLLVITGDVPAWAQGTYDFKAIEPMPGRDRVTPMRPDWCGAYQPSVSCPDPGGACVLPPLDRALGPSRDSYTDQAYALLARTACERPEDPTVQRQIAYYRQGWINLAGVSEADDRAAMKLRMNPSEWDSQRQAFCTAVQPSEEASPEDVEMAKAMKAAGGCKNNALGIYHETGADELAWWLDGHRETPSEVARAVSVLRCMRIGVARRDWPDTANRGVRVAYITCGADARRLDKARLEKEIAGDPWNDYARLHAREAFGEAKAVADYLAADYKKLADKDPSWKALFFDGPEAGWSGWEKDYDANKDAMEAAWAFERKLYGPSRKAREGCGALLRKNFDNYIRARAPKTAQDAIKAAISPVGYVLLENLMACDAAEGRFHVALSEYDMLEPSQHRVYRGPRIASYYGALEALSDILADREKFPLPASELLPPWQLPAKSVRKLTSEMIVNKTVPTQDAKGVIAGVKKGERGALVTFKTITWLEDQYSCKATGRIDHVDRVTGHVVYQSNCILVGKQPMSKTEQPVTVPPEVAEGLKAGQTGVFSVDMGLPPNGIRIGFPKEVHDGGKKLVIWYGVPL